jgi:hypothetical protein
VPDVIVDNASANFTAPSTSWWATTSTAGYYGSDYHARATQAISDSGKFTVPLVDSGSYKVYAWWTGGANRSATTPFVITHSGGNTTVPVNQQINGGQWVELGTYSFTSGSAIRVQVSCWTTTGFYVIADAVKFVKQ